MSAVQSQLDLLRKLWFLVLMRRLMSWLKTRRRREWKWGTKLRNAWNYLFLCPTLASIHSFVCCVSIAKILIMSVSFNDRQMFPVCLSIIFKWMFFFFFFRCKCLVCLMWVNARLVIITYWFVLESLVLLDGLHYFWLCPFSHFHLIFLLIFPWSAAEVHGGPMWETFCKDLCIWYYENASSFRTLQFVLAI